MEFPIELQKILCQFNTRKLLLLMTAIASFVVLFQFLSIPYGTVLLSLLPSDNSFPTGESDHSESRQAYSISSLNISVVGDSSSGIPTVVRNTNQSDLEASMTEANTTKEGPDYISGKQVEPENQFLTEKVIDPIPKKVRKPENEVPQKTDQSMQFERARSEYGASIPLTAALPPDVSSTNLSLPWKPVSNLSSSGIIGDSNTSFVGIEEPKTFSNDNNVDMVPVGQSTINRNSTTIFNSTQKGKLDKPSVPASVADMKYLLLKSHASSRSTIPRWSSVRDQEILLAKSQIENPPILVNERELYPPLFHNISVFKRSYELMEQTLKVYTYKEGAKPIFHQPETKGIYASEGWFMKQMEGNKQFSVNDPKKAHLFYLPFSTRRLEQFLYVPNSHSHKNLIEYLKSYLDLITSKYPFWNRTDGADHFLVGCHDWTPAETREHMGNCIRALCNADISEDFVMGKDASLPETNVHVAKDPNRNIGGKPASERQILAFFAGSMHGYVRPILLEHWENKDPDIKIYSHLGRSKQSRASYVQYMKNSKYCICAKGYEVNSPRVVEAFFYECVPVIISDNFVPPFFEVLNWEAFAVFIAEKDIPNLKNILLSIPDEKYEKLQKRVRKVQRHFLWHANPVKYDIFHMILHSVWYNRVFRVNIAESS